MQAGNWDIEISDAIAPSSLVSGACYVNAAAAAPPTPRVATVDQAEVKAVSKYASSAAKAGAALPKPIGKPSEGTLVLQDASEQTGACQVVVEAFLARKLRDHQRDGVRFLYKVCCHRRCGAQALAVLIRQHRSYLSSPIMCRLSSELHLVMHLSASMSMC